MFCSLKKKLSDRKMVISHIGRRFVGLFFKPENFDSFMMDEPNNGIVKQFFFNSLFVECSLSSNVHKLFFFFFS